MEPAPPGGRSDPRRSSKTTTGSWSSAAATRCRTAKEAALKLIETCAIAASGWSAADAKHGPLGQVVGGTPVFLLGASAFGRESVLDVAPDVLARGGRVYAVGAAGAWTSGRTSWRISSRRSTTLWCPPSRSSRSSSVALELALLRGHDPDRPTGLTKVTRTL